MWRRKLNLGVSTRLYFPYCYSFTISRVVQHYHEAIIAIVHFSIAAGTGVLLNESINLNSLTQQNRAASRHFNSHIDSFRSFFLSDSFRRIAECLLDSFLSDINCKPRSVCYRCFEITRT